MERLSLIGVALLGGLLAGKLAQHLRLPKVSGFLLLGLALGPSGLGFLPDDTVSQLRFLSRLAIALVLFDIGGEFDLREIRRLKGRHLLVSLGDVCTTGLTVALTTWWLGLRWTRHRP
jgi:Kef-type K+ transport system membrane component KefB